MICKLDGTDIGMNGTVQNTIAMRRHDIAGQAQLALYDIIAMKQPELARLFEITLALNFSPALDMAALNVAFKHTIADNPELAAVFRVDDGGDLIVSRLPLDRFAVKVHDCMALDMERALAMVQGESETGFDPATGPLVTLDAFLLADSSCTILLKVSHLVADGWAAELLVSTLIQNYLELPVDTPKATFEDFVDWEEELTSGGNGITQLEFWSNRLKQFGPRLAIGDNAGASLQAGTGRCRYVLSADECLLVRSAAQRHGVSAYVFLLAAYVSAISKLTGSSLVTVRSNAANRTMPGFDSIIGRLAQSSALAFHVDANASMAVLVRDVATEVEKAQQHQGSFWWAFRKFLRENPEPRRPALDQFHFQKWLAQATDGGAFAVLLNDPSSPPLALGDFTLTPVPLNRRAANRDFTTGYFESEETIAVECLYKTAHVAPSTAERLLATHRAILLDAAASAR